MATSKTSTAKASTAKTAAKKTTAKKTTAKKTTAAKKAAVALLKGEKSQLGGILDSILENKTIMNTVTSLFK